MLDGLLQALGGLGLFLLGMSVMTQGLRSLSDQRLRGVLVASTRSPLSGAVTGALATAVLQSSSATTVAAVGFVDAGLLNFPQALGIIFGANIGTTLKGWFVALLGFKFQLTKAMLPLILVGAMMTLVRKRSLEAWGAALAGFGLVFFGIESLQQGMAVFEGVVTPAQFPPETFGGRILLLLLGVLITLVTQSSSAGVAMAMVAVNAGTITLGQAAAVVIGMDFGTTFTAALATIGGNVQARRTGFAHVVYNAMTAVGAFLVLPLFLQAAEWLVPETCRSDPELVLVGFHTFFNTLGVVAVLPFAGRFAHLIERMFPERGNPLVKHLEKSLLGTPDLALRAVVLTLQDLSQTLCGLLANRLAEPANATQRVETELRDVGDALNQTREYLQEIVLGSDPAGLMPDYLAAVHVVDHLHRILDRTRDEARIRQIADDPELEELTATLARGLRLACETDFPMPVERAGEFHDINRDLKRGMRQFRTRAVERASRRELTTETAIQRMDSARWLRRIGYHLWRIAAHMSVMPIPRGEADAGEELDED